MARKFLPTKNIRWQSWLVFKQNKVYLTIQKVGIGLKQKSKVFFSMFYCMLLEWFCIQEKKTKICEFRDSFIRKVFVALHVTIVDNFLNILFLEVLPNRSLPQLILRCFKRMNNILRFIYSMLTKLTVWVTHFPHFTFCCHLLSNREEVVNLNSKISWKWEFINMAQWNTIFEKVFNFWVLYSNRSETVKRGKEQIQTGRTPFLVF